VLVALIAGLGAVVVRGRVSPFPVPEIDTSDT